MVIVGAGIAGLEAARRLTGAGLDVAVLEARGRVGGRLLSVGVGHAGLDLGATWFWPGERRVERLVDELGVATHAQHLDGLALYDTASGVRALDGNPLDVPAGRFVGGAQALAASVADRLPAGTVHLDQRVVAVATGGDGGTCAVRTDRAVFRCRQVVLALPPALVVHSVAFDPALPEVLAGLARVMPVWMGATTKVVARYPEPFWRSEGLAGAAASQLGPLREVHDMSGPGGTPAALFGFAGPGPEHGRPVTPPQVIGQLVRLFGHKAASPVELLVHDWRLEPFTSPPEVERMTAYQLFGDPRFTQPAADGRLHWASTETATESPGHVEGALAAAERAAAAVLASLR